MENQSAIKNNFGSKAINYRLSSTHSNLIDLERMIDFLKPKPDDMVLDVATVLVHFYNIQKALQEMCRVLKPKAKLYVLDCSVIDGEEIERQINRLEVLRDNSHVCSYSKRQWIDLLKSLPVKIDYINLIKTQYKLPEWFDRMGTSADNRQKIFELLNNLSKDSKTFYQFNETFIDSYYIEIIAKKI